MGDEKWRGAAGGFVERKIDLAVNFGRFSSMNWQQICEDPSLQDLPYKIETNEYGQIVMSPASNQHSADQGRITKFLLRLLDEGEVFPEWAMETAHGVKVPDVVWCSPEFLLRHGEANLGSLAPEICIEVSSPLNSDRELIEKKQLYFDQRARSLVLRFVREPGFLRPLGGDVGFEDRSGFSGKHLS
jgi:Uma2 family endonuclease